MLDFTEESSNSEELIQSLEKGNITGHLIVLQWPSPHSTPVSSIVINKSTEALLTHHSGSPSDREGHAAPASLFF